MGQALQQNLRFRKDPQALLESQRRWIIQRDRTCGSTTEILFSCLLDMTKQRVTALSEDAAGTTEADLRSSASSATTLQPPLSPTTEAQGSPSPAAAPQPVGPVPQVLPVPPVPKPSQSQPESNPTVLAKQTSSVPPPSNNLPASRDDQGPNPVILLIGAGLVLWLGSMVVRDIRKRRRRQDLLSQYGEEVADRILAHEVWQGMTDEQLVASWGNPVEVGREVLRNKSKETWKYLQTGRNRFANRVYLENGVVIGWKV
jgi:Lysozyme inhibitor LprI